MGWAFCCNLLVCGSCLPESPPARARRALPLPLAGAQAFPRLVVLLNHARGTPWKALCLTFGSGTRIGMSQFALDGGSEDAKSRPSDEPAPEPSAAGIDERIERRPGEAVQAAANVVSDLEAAQDVRGILEAVSSDAGHAASKGA
ncbi:unnamed protein product [Symbiodinium natans]|uniref:Uncharacterized protein n=1 Tax=Symbiodinium natans TaxID=878477 RepID=A0A812STT6_9DINO|nr:unnamed protein product [Symbiodinium natans]